MRIQYNLDSGASQVHLVRSESNLTVKTKLRSLRIKDELLGRSTMTPHYLAYSVVRNDATLSSPTSSDWLANQSPMVVDEDDFRDALQEFLPTPDSSVQSLNLGHFEADPSQSLLSNQDYGRGRVSSSEIFYEALGSDNSDFVSVTFMTKVPGSLEYDGIDTQVLFPANVYSSGFFFSLREGGI